MEYPILINRNINIYKIMKLGPPTFYVNKGQVL